MSTKYIYMFVKELVTQPIEIGMVSLKNALSEDPVHVYVEHDRVTFRTVARALWKGIYMAFSDNPIESCFWISNEHIFM